ncbi:MAG: TadE/TadG family type IV pilus assembly protein [Actinomycetota bacterium]
MRSSTRSGGGARLDARPRAGESGQATVEFALALPVILVFFLALFQVALIARDQVRTQHAARVAAREASVGAGGERVLAATADVLEGAELELVRNGAVGEAIEVRVRYRSETALPLVGALIPDVELEASAVMRRER